MEKEKVAVYVSKGLYDKVKSRVKESGGEFKSVDGYVEFVLREVLKEDDGAKEAYTRDEEDSIKKRLKSLGYL